MKVSKALPTVFAKNIAIGVDLLDNEQTRENHSDYDYQMKRLAEFQQLAVVCSFEDALLAYKTKDLTKKQKDALELIYKTTKPWLYGHIAAEAMDQISKSFTSGKDKKELAEIVLRCMENTRDGSGQTEEFEGLLVKVTKQKSTGLI